MQKRAAEWLLTGFSPERLALSLALGFVLGCIPVVGVPTGLCVLIALAFRLNHPAIQAANYVAMPFQVALIAPLVKLGGWLMPTLAAQGRGLSLLLHSPIATAFHAPGPVLAQLVRIAGQALLAWLVFAAPAALVLTAVLTGALRRVAARGAL
ncbi:MAG TPA: DUF2062 domain-containing protein [Terracidiphilus sp.]|nr:DUF2062 domain-containing protein [Terracidiphilus sp.]